MKIKTAICIAAAAGVMAVGTWTACTPPVAAFHDKEAVMAAGTQTAWAQPTEQKISMTVLAPEANGLVENQSHLPTLVQDEFIQAFSGFFDVRNMASVDAALKELASGAYADTLEALRNIGNLTNTSLYMVGKMTRTGYDYHLTMSVLRIADNITTASYSNTFNYWQLNNRTGIRLAAFELLQKMGVTLTAEARERLIGAADERYINSRNTYAQGVAAQRQGSEVAALSYYLQAAAFDPSMREAVDRGRGFVRDSDIGREEVDDEESERGDGGFLVLRGGRSSIRRWRIKDADINADTSELR
jgi:hypothetical protein